MSADNSTCTAGRSCASSCASRSTSSCTSSCASSCTSSYTSSYTSSIWWCRQCSRDVYYMREESAKHVW